MALYVNRPQQRSELQEKIAAEMTARLNERQKLESDKEYKPVMSEESKKATGKSVFWTGVVVIAVAVVALFLLLVNNGV